MFDRENMFSYKQAVAASGPATDIVCVGPDDVGAGQPLVLHIVTPAVEGGGTVTARLETYDVEGGAYDKVADYEIPADKLAKGGSVLAAPLPNGLKTYLKLSYVLAGTVDGFVPTAGLDSTGQTNG